MFVTELMKIQNIRVNLSERFSFQENDKEKIVLLDDNRIEPKSDLSKLIFFIKEKEIATLADLRAQSLKYSDASQLILMINQYIIWNIFTLSIIDENKQTLITMENATYGADALINLAEIKPTDHLIFSRFVSLFREDKQIILSKPGRDKRIIINEKKIDHLIFALFSGSSVEAALKQYNDTQHNSLKLIMQMLLAEQFLIHFEGNIPIRNEEGSDIDKQWDTADLTFHFHSRTGYHFGAFGGAFPFVNKIEPRPGIRPLPEGERIDLYQPDINHLIANDPSLTQLQLQRVSIRKYDEDNPINLKQLGEFLYRSARVLFQTSTEVTNVMDPSQKTEMEFAWRPYPTGGASYELEVYLTVDRAADLAAGMYYYSPNTHQLIKISEKNNYTETLITAAHISCARIVRPQVLLHIAARFQRVSWKYHAIAYATMLRNTGVLYQTFYLNAIAMGIAPCGLGSGDARTFSKASGNDLLVEGNIGEFMLGSMPKDLDLDLLLESRKDIKAAIKAGAGK